MNLLTYLNRYKAMILCSLFSFYLGCLISISFLRIDCADAGNKAEVKTEFDKVEYAVLILSAPDHTLIRDTIRSTWKNLAKNVDTENGEVFYKWNPSQNVIPPDFIKFYFVIGIQGLDSNKIMDLISEESKNKDVLLLTDYQDSYKSLSEKMLKTLLWVDENLRNLKYVIKSDDDSFVRVDLIVKELEQHAPNYYAPEWNQYASYKVLPNSPQTYTGVYWGYFNGRGKIFASGKWKEESWFLCDYYLPYTFGGGYVISQSIVRYIARNANLLSKYNAEDVSMGVWTAALDRINRIHDMRFDTEWISRGCSNKMLVRHKQTPEELTLMYKMLLKSHGDKLCANETMVRTSYMYNWNVLPSQCCRLT